MGIFGDLIDAIFGESKLEDELAGTTEDNACPLKSLLPLFCSYDALDVDIKYNLNHTDSDRVFNFRTMQFPHPIERLIVVSTSIDRTTNGCMVDYTMMTLNSFGIFYNLYDILEFFLLQVREKKDGVYKYNISKELRKKMPTFSALMSNTERNDKKPTYGLPFITFLDEEQEYPLLCAFFKDDALKKQGDMDKLHISLIKIVSKLVTESNKAGLLDQSKQTLFNNGLRMMRIMVGVDIM